MATKATLEDVYELLAVTHSAVQQLTAKVEGQASPSGASPLSQLVRPPAGAEPYGVGTVMTGPDVAEYLKRAIHCVNWVGGLCRTPEEADAIWAEIERLKTGKWDVIEPYANLDPLFCGVGLLTGLFDIAALDGRLGQPGEKRRAFKGQTVPRFLEEQFRGSGGPGIGGE